MHNLNVNEITIKTAFFSVKEKAWHGLGQIVTDYPTSAEAIKHAQLDFQIEKRPLFTNTTEQLSQIEVPDFYANVRSDNNAVLGIVGKDYKIIQNTDAFEFFDSIVGGDGIQYETAGALGKGERIFITAKLPNYIKVGKDDLIEQYLFLTTTHDGSGSITAAFTPIRIVCNNTLNAAMGNKSNTVKIRHTANAKDRLNQAHKLMGITNELSQQMSSIFNQWSKVRITDQKVKDLITLALAPNKEALSKIDAGAEVSTAFKNIIDNAYSYAMSDASQLLDTTKGTVFGVYNAVTAYLQNVKEYGSADSKAKSILFGGNSAQRGQKAFDLCDQYVKSNGAKLFIDSSLLN